MLTLGDIIRQWDSPYWLPALGYSVGPTFGPQTMQTHEGAGLYSMAGGITPNSWTAFQEVMRFKRRWTSSVLPGRIFAGGLVPNRDACPPGPLEGISWNSKGPVNVP